MRSRFSRAIVCASLVAAAIALRSATPAAQQQTSLQAPPITQDAIDRAQAAYQADQTRNAIARDKEGVVANLVERWRGDIGESAKGIEGFKAAFLAADTEKLVRLTQAKTWDALVAIQLGLNPDATLGSKTNDLVFTPLTPCRAFDSRLGTGVFAGPYTSGQTIGIYVTDSLNGGGSRNQGGVASCGFPFSIGTAVALNITVVPVSGSGDLKIFPYGAAAPNASIINFYAGLNLANATSAAIALSNSTNDLNITVEYASSVHIIVDIMGYYSQPQATALDSLRVSSGVYTLATGVQNGAMDSPACPSGYALTGGGTQESGPANNFFWWWSYPGDASATFWRAGARNDSTITASVTVYAVCARTPGR